MNKWKEFKTSFINADKGWQKRIIEIGKKKGGIKNGESKRVLYIR